MVPNSKTSASVENPTGASPSQLICPMDVPSSGLDRSPSILEPELRCDHDGYTNAGVQPAASSMPCGADAIPDNRPPSDCPPAEAICVDGPPSLDTQIPLVHSRATGSAPGGVSTCDTECDISEARGAELSCSVLLSTREHPINHSPQAGPVCPSPSESDHPNTILSPCRATLDPDATPSCAVSVPSGSKNLPFPRPPPEVAALLTTQSFGNVVSPVLARNSPLVPWDLPSEIGYFWLGLFRISGVKVNFMSAIRSEKRFQFIAGLLSFARWKHARGKVPPRRRSWCNVPGAFLWNGYPGARTSSRTTSRARITSGRRVSCGHGGNRSIPNSQTSIPSSGPLRVPLLPYQNRGTTLY